MKHVKIEELENNLDYYLELSAEEDLFIMKDDEVISVFTSPDKYRLNLIKELRGKYGKVDKDIDYKEIIGEEIIRKHTKKADSN